MRSFLTRRLTYANVVASLALFLALGGVSYAATQLASNSVGTAQLRSNAVTGPKVKNGSLTASDLTAGARTALKGDTGATGPAGAAGAAGISAAFATPTGAKAVNFSPTKGKAVTVASLALPAGTFSVVAKVVANNNGAANAGVRCQLLSGTTKLDDGGAQVFLAPDRGLDRAVLPLTAAVVLDAAASLDVSCAASGVKGQYHGPMITADQVGSLGSAETTDTTETTTTDTTTTDTTAEVTPTG